MDKPGGRQVGQVMRQRVLLQPQRLGNLGRAHAARGKAHEQAKDGQPVRVAERGEGMSGGNISIFLE